MRKHPLLALTITLTASATLLPTAIAQAMTTKIPTTKNGAPAASPRRRTSTRHGHQAGKPLVASRVFTGRKALTGPDPLLVQLPRIPRRYAVSVFHPLATPAAGGVWLSLRLCESGGNYQENSGNGYYGAYQFAAATWWAIGYTGLPSNAPPAVQDRAAAQLQDLVGWSAWPQCSAVLGL